MYIGLSTNFHDSAVAIVDLTGHIIYAQATERFHQNKISLGSPSDGYFWVNEILKNHEFEDYEIGTNWKQFNSWFSFNLIQNTGYFIRNQPWMLKSLLRWNKMDENRISSIFNFSLSYHLATRSMAGASFKLLLNKKYNLPFKKNLNFDHHDCHAYYAYFTSPVKNATIAIIDGNGDDIKSLSIYLAKDQNIKRVFRNPKGASLGDYYGLITDWCGFLIFAGEEWKVMGLAPYGEIHEEFLSDLKQWITTEGYKLKIKNKKKLIEIENKIKNGGYSGLNREKLAFTGQFYYEEMVNKLLNAVHQSFPNENLILSGGCALNSSYNGKIHLNTPFKNIFIPSAPGDDGCAVGAALLAFKKCNPKKEIPYHQINPYLGDFIEEKDLEHILQFSGYKIRKASYNEVYEYTAQKLVEGNIIAWCQGKAEFGPRALGNRSILAHPGMADMKDKINSKVKFREEFRPFAPSVLKEFALEIFEDYFPTPYMERVLKIKKEFQSKLPAVNHIDNSGRLQSVDKEMNLHFHNLITNFHQKSGIPVLLNTSFNVMGKPIVHSVEDMITVFASSGIDLLVINDYLIEKK